MAIRVGKTREGEPMVNKFKVWEVKDRNGFINASCSTGRKKNKDSDEWINSYWNLGFVGNCKEAALSLKKGDTIVSSEFQVEFKKANDGKYYQSVTIFSFSVEGGQTAPSESGGFQPVDSEDDLPFS